MQRMILTVAFGAILALCISPQVASADHGHWGHGHGHRHHHAHRPSGIYHHYQRARPRPYHYDLYWHGDHYDAVPHRGAHHYDRHDHYHTYRPRYGHGYYGGGVYLNGISVRW